MIKMSTIWDRTSAVLGGRAGALAGIAFTTLFVPLTLLQIWSMLYPPGTPVYALGALPLLIVVGIAAVVGVLAMIALASDPATTRAAAWRLARARLLPAIGVSALLGLIVFVALLPLGAGLVMSGIDLNAMAAGIAQPKMSGGLGVFLVVYYLAFMILILVAATRLSVINAVVLHERLGIGAIRRSFALTKGIGWRLIGVLLLYVILLVIVRSAAQLVVGILLRLILGPAQIGTALLLSNIAGVAVTTAFSVVVAAFTAQLYVALAARQTDLV